MFSSGILGSAQEYGEVHPRISPLDKHPIATMQELNSNVITFNLTYQYIWLKLATTISLLGPLW